MLSKSIIVGVFMLAGCTTVANYEPRDQFVVACSGATELRNNVKILVEQGKLDNHLDEVQTASHFILDTCTGPTADVDLLSLAQQVLAQAAVLAKAQREGAAQ